MKSTVKTVVIVFNFLNIAPYNYAAEECQLLALSSDIKQHEAFEKHRSLGMVWEDKDRQSYVTLCLQMYEFPRAIESLCKHKLKEIPASDVLGKSHEVFHAMFMRKLELDTVKTERNWAAITKTIHTIYVENWRYSSYFMPLENPLKISYPEYWGAAPYRCTLASYNQPVTICESRYVALHSNLDPQYFFLIPKEKFQEAFKNNNTPFTFVLLIESKEISKKQCIGEATKEIHATLHFPYIHDPEYNWSVVSQFEKPRYSISYKLEQNDTTKLFAYHALHHTQDDTLPKEIGTLLKPIETEPKKVSTDLLQQWWEKFTALIPTPKMQNISTQQGRIYIHKNKKITL